MNKTKFFNFGDLFGKRKPNITPINDPNAPQEVKDLGAAIRKMEPLLINFVQIARKIPVRTMEADINIIVDGKPCNFHFKDDFTPEMVQKMMDGKLGEAPVNLPVVSDVPRIPKADMVASIEGLLRQMYPTVVDEDVLGAIWSPHHNAAMKLAEILEKARDRDRALIGREIQNLLKQFRY